MGLRFLGLIDALFRKRDDVAVALYRSVVEEGRAPHWYLDGEVPDTLDGRFDAIATVLALVLIRLDALDGGAPLAARLTERFVDDMDGQLREIGIGDLMVGKHMGKLMSLLGGRIAAVKSALATDAWDDVLVRNLYRGAAPSPAALAHSRAALAALHGRLAQIDLAALAAGFIE